MTRRPQCRHCRTRTISLGAIPRVKHRQMTATASGTLQPWALSSVPERPFGFGHLLLSPEVLKASPAAVAAPPWRPSPAEPPPGSTPPRHSRPGSPASGCRLASGRSFHSSTVRPRPSVFTRYSAVRCSANSRCRSGLSPKSDRHPGRPSAPPAGHGRTSSSSWCRRPRAARPACPGRWGSASSAPPGRPCFRLYSENGMLDAPTNRPWLGMTTAEWALCRQNW